MILATFFYSKRGMTSDEGGKICLGFKVEGHAGFAEYGRDLVCAAVSSSVQMCCNGITHIMKKKVKISCCDGLVELKTVDFDEGVQFFLKALELQIDVMSKNYDKNLKLVKLEV